MNKEEGKLKKLSYFLLILCLFVISNNVQAQPVVVQAIQNEGVEVAFPIRIETKNITTAFSGFLELSYDPTLLTLKQVKTGDLTKNFTVNSTINSKNYLFWKFDSKQGICRIIFATAEPLGEKGVLAEVVFTASLQVPTGKLIEINIEQFRFNELKQFPLNKPEQPMLTITTSSLPDGTVGTQYSQPLQGSGGVTPYTWSVSAGTLPAGLTLDASTGVISGNPTAVGTSNFTIQVQDSSSPAKTATGNLPIIIVNPSSPPIGKPGKPTHIDS